MATRQERRRAPSPALVALGEGLDEVRARLDDLDDGERAEVARAWLAHRACADVDTAPFFPVPDSARARPSVYARAQEVCGRCPVWAYCLADGLFDHFGYRGRATPAQRATLRQDRGLVAPRYIGPGP